MPLRACAAEGGCTAKGGTRAGRHQCVRACACRAAPHLQDRLKDVCQAIKGLGLALRRCGRRRRRRVHHGLPLAGGRCVHHGVSCRGHHVLGHGGQQVQRVAGGAAAEGGAVVAGGLGSLRHALLLHDALLHAQPGTSLPAAPHATPRHAMRTKPHLTAPSAAPPSPSSARTAGSPRRWRSTRAPPPARPRGVVGQQGGQQHNHARARVGMAAFSSSCHPAPHLAAAPAAAARTSPTACGAASTAAQHSVVAAYVVRQERAGAPSLRAGPHLWASRPGWQCEDSSIVQTDGNAVRGAQKGGGARAAAAAVANPQQQQPA